MHEAKLARVENCGTEEPEEYEARHGARFDESLVGPLLAHFPLQPRADVTQGPGRVEEGTEPG